MRFPLLAAIRKSFLKSYRRFKKNKTRRQYQFSFVASVMIGLFTIGYLNCGKKQSMMGEGRFDSSSIKHQFLTTPPIKPSDDPKRFGKNIIFFDAPIVPFDQTKEGKLYIERNGRPDVYDTWGYPVQPNVYQNIKPREDTVRKKLSSLFIERVYADDEGELPGQVNCREDETVTGYFEAFFEDVAAGTGVGYDDPEFGQARRTAVCDVLREIATLLKLDQTNVTPDILFAITPEEMPEGALAYASAYYGMPISTGTSDNGTLYRHIVTGLDPTLGAGYFDASLVTSFQLAWSVDSQLSQDTYDFHTVIMHEVLHALGFMSTLSAVVGNSGQEVFHNTFSEHLYEEEPSLAANQFFSFDQMLSPVLQVPNGTPSPWFINNLAIYQGKKNIVGAGLDGVRPLYTPMGWQQGSSISHFDMMRAPGVEYVMNASIGLGIDREIHEHEKEVLCHLGYQVLGMTGCGGFSPIAYDDSISNNTSCKKFLENDLALSGGDLSIESFEIIDFPASGVTIYYDNQTSNCSGSNINSNSTNPIGAKSIKLISTVGNSFSYKFKYRVKDSVTNRISMPAIIRGEPECLVDSLEYVCNGDFELGSLSQTDSALTNTFFLWDVPFWNTAGSSPDLVFKNHPSNHNYWNLPYTNFNGASLDMVDNGSYAAFMDMSYYAPPNNLYNIESITTPLKAPLSQGSTYILSFDVNVFPSGYTLPSSPPIIQVLLHTVDMISEFPLLQPNPSLNNATVILQEELPLNSLEGTGWIHVSHSFMATQPFQYLALVPQENDTYINLHVDNVSIRQITNSISGLVYNDLNDNGAIDSGEPGLGGVTVGLFNGANSMSPVQTAVTSVMPEDLGHYEFENINFTSWSNYFVALIPETNFASITQPAENNLMTTFDHSIHIPSVNGVSFGNKNFGILLNGQPPPRCIGDFNEDGYVSVADLLILNAAMININYMPLDYNGDGIPGPSADMDSNGVVNQADMQIFETVYGNSMPTCSQQ